MSNPDDDRARLERLIAAADRVANRPVPPPPPPRSRAAAMVALGVIGIGSVVLGVKLASGNDDSGPGDTAATPGTTVVPTVSPTSPSTTIPTVITLPPTSPPVVTPTPSTTAPATTTTWVGTPGEPVRSAVYLGGQLRLDGAVPDSRVATSLTQKWAKAFGTPNVSSEFVIAAGVPRPTSEPLLAHDAMQFPPLSAELQPPALELLDRLALLLQQNPKVTLDIDAHTDGVGDPAANLQLSEFRAGAVVIYLAGKGIDPARLHAKGHGSASPVADDATEAGQIQNRRVEFTVHHLLD